MRETDLVTMNASLTGWFDTGATTVALTVARHHYDPSLPVGKRLSERSEIFGYTAEVFLTAVVEEALSIRLGKAFSAYTTAMCFP